MKKVITATLVGGAIIGSLLGAGTANAQGRGDSFYLAWLDNQDVSYGTDADVIELGHTVCSVLNDNPSTGTVMAIGYTIKEAGFTTSDAADIVVGSVASFCSEHWQLVPGQEGKSAP